MVDAYLRGKSGYGLSFNEVTDGGTPYSEGKLDIANLTTITAADTTDYLIVFQDGVPYKVQIGNIITNGWQIVSVFFPGTLATATTTGNENWTVKAFQGISGRINTIRGVKIVGASGYVGTGNSVFRICDAVNVTLPSGDTTTDFATIEIALPDPPVGEVSIVTAGLHRDVKIDLFVEVR